MAFKRLGVAAIAGQRPCGAQDGGVERQAIEPVQVPGSQVQLAGESWCALCARPARRRRGSAWSRCRESAPLRRSAESAMSPPETTTPSRLSSTCAVLAAACCPPQRLVEPGQGAQAPVHSCARARRRCDARSRRHLAAGAVVEHGLLQLCPALEQFLEIDTEVQPRGFSSTTCQSAACAVPMPAASSRASEPDSRFHFCRMYYLALRPDWIIGERRDPPCETPPGVARAGAGWCAPR